MPYRNCWIVSTKRAGHLNQCIALAEALDILQPKTILIKGKSASDLVLRKILDNLKNYVQIAATIAFGPLPRDTLIISSGRSVIWLCKLWKLLRGRSNFIVYVGTPKTGLCFADCLVRSEHEVTLSNSGQLNRHCPVKSEIIVRGVMVRSQLLSMQNETSVAGPRKVGVLIGGRSPAFDYSGPRLADFVSALRKLADTQKYLISITFSARTPFAAARLIRRELAGQRSILWTDISARISYDQFMQESDYLVVCPDSITMISECCSSGKPVFVPELDRTGDGQEHYQFLSEFCASRHIADFASFPGAGEFVPLPNQSKLAAAKLCELMNNQ